LIKSGNDGWKVKEHDGRVEMNNKDWKLWMKIGRDERLEMMVEEWGYWMRSGNRG
jgi:hypothetical protein